MGKCAGQSSKLFFFFLSKNKTKQKTHPYNGPQYISTYALKSKNSGSSSNYTLSVLWVLELQFIWKSSAKVEPL